MSTPAVFAAPRAPRATPVGTRRVRRASAPRTAATSPRVVRAVASDASKAPAKVVVVGGSGFVGSRGCDKLRAAGVADVVSVSKSGGNGGVAIDLSSDACVTALTDAMKGAADFSGLRLWATRDWEKDAKMRVGLLSVADPFARLPQNLPADTADARYTTHCPPGCTKTFAAPLRVFASMTHAHLRAKHVLTSVGTPDPETGLVPEGDGPSTSGWRVVVDAKDDAGAFSHDRQKFEPAEFTIEPGDALRTECRYDTRGASSSIPFGPATSQEMCMQVFLYYPKQPEFLCGYYDERRFWCGDAEGFIERDGAESEAFGETCRVFRVAEKTEETGDAEDVAKTETCAEAEARNERVVFETNAHGEGVVMRR